MLRLAGPGRPVAASERVVLDTTFGLYLGWVAVATCANITAALVESGVRAPDGLAQAVAVAVLVVVAGVGLLIARSLASLPVAAAMAWGLAWIAVGRLADQPASAATGLAALTAAAVILVAHAGVLRRRLPAGATRAA
jgi:hypothetical protein